MKLRLLPVIGLTALLTLTAAAREGLREILHPKADLPSFRVLLPSGWTEQVDARGNLLFANKDRSANFSLSFVPTAEPREALDALAKVILAGTVVAPWDSREPAEISGHRGYRYTARVRHANGVEVRAELLLVAVADRHIASCALLLGARVSAGDETLARLVQSAIKLVPTP